MGPTVCKRARGLKLGAFKVPRKFRAHARPPHHRLQFNAPAARDSEVQQGRNPLRVVSRSNGPQRLAPQAPGIRGRYRLIVALHARSVLRQMALHQLVSQGAPPVGGTGPSNPFPSDFFELSAGVCGTYGCRFRNGHLGPCSTMLSPPKRQRQASYAGMDK